VLAKNFGKVFPANPADEFVGVGQNDGPFNDIAQFAQVARPGIMSQDRFRLSGKPLELFAALPEKN